MQASDQPSEAGSGGRTAADEAAYQRLSGLCAVVERWTDERGRILEVQEGSLLAEDDVLTAPYQSSHVIAVFLGSALDHLQALRALLVDAEALHMSAPFTLTRSAIESASQALWLLTPDERQVRVQRRLQMAADNAREQSRAVEILDPEARGRLQQRLDRFAGLGEAAGIPRDHVLGRAPSLVTMVRAASDLVAPDLPLEFLWRLGSGYAHGNVWALLVAGVQERLPGSQEAVAHLSVTADAETALLFMGAAVLALSEAQKLHDRHRLRWRTSCLGETSAW